MICLTLHGQNELGDARRIYVIKINITNVKTGILGKCFLSDALKRHNNE